MKRSEINAALRELEAMCKKYSCFLPPFCHFTPDEWKRHVTILQNRAKDGSVPSPAPDSSDASPVHPDGSGNRT